MKSQDSDFETDLKAAVECMRNGGIILYPTDTVWGIGCDAKNSEAVKKIYSLKKRADGKSMLVLTDSENNLKTIADDIPAIAYDLIQAAVKPLTIIYDHVNGVAPELLAPDGSLGVRITSERFSRGLCRMLNRPVVSTSANISGEKSPSFFSDISDEILNGVDYVVNYRRNDKTPSQPSNIIKLSAGGIVKIIR